MTESTNKGAGHQKKRKKPKKLRRRGIAEIAKEISSFHF